MQYRNSDFEYALRRTEEEQRNRLLNLVGFLNDCGLSAAQFSTVMGLVADFVDAPATMLELIGQDAAEATMEMKRISEDDGA